jgi:hypothetical protein
LSYSLEAGYAIRRTERDFELACVSRELIGKFSKRTALIEQIFREEYIVIEAEARALAKRTNIGFFDTVAEVKARLVPVRASVKASANSRVMSS